MRGLWLVLVAAGCDGRRPACDTAQVFDHATQTCTAYVAEDPVPADVWRPAPGTTWQWQLTGSIDTSVPVDMYDVDLFDAPDSVFTALQDRTVICYFSAGSAEDFREDAVALPDDATGDRLMGWSDERWVDVTHPAVRQWVEDRLDYAVERGCDGVEPDNVDGYANRNGFFLTPAEQLQFNRFVADEAHRRGLSVGLKNDVDQLAELEPWFDWALNEECHLFEECGVYTPFRGADKAVFHTEYVRNWRDAPELAARVCVHSGFSTLVKTLDLGPEFLSCPAGVP